MHSTIAILDFGSQYTQLIARAIREQGVYSVIFPCSASPEEVRRVSPRGLVLSGGPSSVLDEEAPRCHESFLEGEIPVLGICYGMQFLCRELGGDVRPGSAREYGRAEIVVADGGRRPSPPRLFSDLPKTQAVWMSHGDWVERLPKGFHPVAFSRNGTKETPARDETPANSLRGCVAVEDEAGRRFGLQFHPEVRHTKFGKEILSRFLFDVCGCRADWTPSSFIEETISAVRERVGDSHVVLGLSGGVDSSVAAVLLHRALGKKLHCIFVDNGLLRKGERKEVIERFREAIGIPLHVVDASERFVQSLIGVTDPEEKRRIIGRLFIETFRGALKELTARDERIRFLAQGTLYPDVIESVSATGGPSAKIKTHHNVGGLPDDLNFELIEPLKMLFKDDVRRIGRELGIQEEILQRHPFPGPGLAVRILGEVTPEGLAILREADAIFIEELRRAGKYDDVSQALAVLLPVRSVGVMGDARTYERVVALRAVTTEDFMTADWARLPADLLARVANRIINEVSGVNRVVYDISSKPPATIEWE
ncbi:MAG: glutamine-hydrolyzing GMP synthase [Candidatus Hydrogenedentota bacterium]|nr:MAG: glutamine-hydrolyzing GMP synthase [Candidatus Hydrogenedentota bacterium]